MTDATIDRIKCGQVFILSNNSFALTCEFCGDDFNAFEAFRSHIKEHFPDSEDEICISSDSDCELVTPDIPEVQDVQLPSTLQNDDACGSQTTVAESLLIEREWVPSSSDNELSDGSSESEQSVRNQRRRKRPKRTRIIPSSSNGNCNISEADFEDGSQLGTMQPSYRPDIRTKVASNGLVDESDSIKKRLKCRKCSNDFIDEKSLNKHFRLVHLKDLRHPCSICDKRFFYPYLRDNHIRENHLPDSDPRRYFECKQCDGKFKSYYSSRLHKPCNR